MRKLLFVAVALLLTTASASAQCTYFGCSGDIGRSHGYVPQPGYRAINHDPATGRTYARDADYVITRKKQRGTKKAHKTK
jgi:hypothetical protein